LGLLWTSSIELCRREQRADERYSDLCCRAGRSQYHEIRDGIPNPTRGIQLAAVRGKRERIASPAEAERLISAVLPSERAAWACAFYAGLRLGEIRALRWEDVNLARGVIHVRRGWDQIEGEISRKSVAGERVVPIAAVLRELLIEYGMETRRQKGLVFGATEEKPFTLTAMRNRARSAWKKARLQPITTHEARHTFASMMIAAGVNAKQLSTYMGHASIAITFDRYGHLMPGNEAEAAELLDIYLAETDGES
jgi:integrase